MLMVQPDTMPHTNVDAANAAARINITPPLRFVDPSRSGFICDHLPVGMIVTVPVSMLAT